MARPKITLFVDIVSPFAYMAYHVLRNDPIFNQCDITYTPIFLGGLFKLCGNSPPLTVKNKDKWIAKERCRWANAFSIPMKEGMPAGFPPVTLTAMRALAVIQQGRGARDQQSLTKALDALFSEFWVTHTPVQEVQVLLSSLSRLFGEDEAKAILDATNTAEGKALLAKNTSDAFEKGAFGLPWFSCTNADGAEEGFWGVDRLGQVVHFLGLEKPASSGLGRAFL